MTAWMADLRPEFTNHMRSGGNPHRDSARGNTTCEATRGGRLPSAGNQTASKGAGDSPCGDRTAPGCGLAGDHCAYQGVLHPWAEAAFPRRLVAHLFVTRSRHAKINRAADRVFSKRGSEALAKPCCALSPFLWSVPQMRPSRAGCGAHGGLRTKSSLHVLSASRLPHVLLGRRRAGQNHEHDCKGRDSHTS